MPFGPVIPPSGTYAAETFEHLCGYMWSRMLSKVTLGVAIKVAKVLQSGSKQDVSHPSVDLPW